MIKRIKKSIIARIVNFLYPEIHSRLYKKIDTKRIKHFGQNSFFWGKEHYVSGMDNLVIGENVHINDNCHIRAEGGVEIGDNTHISSNFILYSINHDYKGNALPYDQNMIKKKVIIGKNVWIGINVCVAPGTIIGDGCIIAMGTTLSGNIPPLSIVGNPKAIIISNRDELHYNELVKNNKYGAINGKLYNWSSSKKIEKSGDVYTSWRANCELIEISGKHYIKKNYINTVDGVNSFETELSALKRFQQYDWCPKLFDSGENYIIIEYFSNELRLDQYKGAKDINLLSNILWAMLDIYCEGYAHRDIHSKNIFVTNSGIKFIDFESVFKNNQNSDFYESYDITGKGLPSPFQTNNMCFFSSDENSLSKLFKIKTKEELIAILETKFKDEMLNSSITFKSQIKNKPLGRHKLRDSNIYATFNLKYIKVSTKEGQRNTLKRFKKFEIDTNIIKEKTVLDIGSNIGGTLLGLVDMNPKLMTGWEFDEDKVNLANKIASYNSVKNIEFKVKDVEKLDLNSLTKFDVVFCLAVVEHLKDKELLFKVLAKVCNNILFFEGNSNSNIDFITTQLKLNGFNHVEYLGFSDDEKNAMDNVRPLFKATR